MSFGCTILGRILVYISISTSNSPTLDFQNPFKTYDQYLNTYDVLKYLKELFFQSYESFYETCFYEHK